MADQMSPEELEQFQKLSDQYQADLPGPLIGEKLPMDVLATEYAQADAAFVVKTTGLAASHSAYRAVKGDGQCGWRATVFSYFEILLQSGDPSMVQTEKIRFQTFEDTMRMIGLDYDILVDMFDSTWELYDKVLEAVQSSNPHESVVLNFLNDENVSNSIVYHFKMVTSAYMQLHADQYEPFLEMPIEQYRVARIDPTNQEIDQMGLQALTDAVLRPANFGLVVIYLDRSVVSEANAHTFAEGEPTIRLLYRPGHYDIIYKHNQPLQVYLQNHQSTPQYIDDPHGVSQARDVHSFLFPTAQMQDSYGYSQMSYDQPTQHMQQGHYNSFFQPQYTAYQQPELYATMPQPMPPVSIPMQAPPQPSPPQQQPHPRATIHRSTSSRSVTLSPSPSSIAPPLANEPQIRFSSNMYNMRNHQAAPITPSK